MKTPSKLLSTILVAMAAFIYSCGGNKQDSTSDTTAVTTETSEQSVVTDPEAKSNSKGIGRFTSVEVGPVDKAMAAKGEVVFTAKCAACHKVTADKVVGPGLKDVTKRRTPEWIMNMITNPEEMTKKDPVGKALFEKHLIQMTFQNVSDEESRQILEYFRQIDAQ